MISLFNGKKQKDEQYNQVLTCLKEFSEQLKSMNERLQKLEAAVEENRKEMNRQRMSQEDNIEFLQEINDSLKELVEDNQSRTQIKEDTVNNLLKLVEAYEENIWNMSQFVKKSDSMFYQQLCIMEDNLAKYRKNSEIIMINREDDDLDYEYHDVLDVYPTVVEEQDKKIAKIYVPGVIYKGRVRKKAKVTIYRFKAF